MLKVMMIPGEWSLGRGKEKAPGNNPS